MAAVDHYSITATDLTMAAFPFNESSPFDLSDYILLDEGPVEWPRCPLHRANYRLRGLFSPVAEVGNMTSARSASYVDSGGGSGGGGCNNSSTRMGSSDRRSVAELEHRVAFRTKSGVEVMDDGFKWRKYGKKSVKNSPNPRSYYRCSTEEYPVKKRVERDPKEPSYVTTTYEGIHNHSSLDVAYDATQDSKSGRFVVSGCRRIPQSS